MIVEREMTQRDRAFVVSTWARGQQYGMRISEAFRFVNRLLDEGTVRVVVLASDERTVHAWACVGDGVLHYAYVPPELRNEGLAKRAITAALGAYEDHIAVSHRWPRSKEHPTRRFQFHPHALLRSEAA